jgi:hypothetical protein
VTFVGSPFKRGCDMGTCSFCRRWAEAEIRLAKLRNFVKFIVVRHKETFLALADHD